MTCNAPVHLMYFLIYVTQEYYQYKQQSIREISDLNNVLEKLRDENQSLKAEEKEHKMEKKGWLM